MDSSQPQPMHATQCPSNFQSLYTPTLTDLKQPIALLQWATKTTERPPELCQTPGIAVKLWKLSWWSQRALQKWPLDRAITCDRSRIVAHGRAKEAVTQCPETISYLPTEKNKLDPRGCHKTHIPEELEFQTWRQESNVLQMIHKRLWTLSGAVF